MPAAGRIEVGGVVVHTRDGAKITASDTIAVKGLEDSQVVLVDLA